MENYIDKSGQDVVLLRNKITQCKKAQIKLQDQINNYTYKKKHMIYFKHLNTSKEDTEVADAFKAAELLYLQHKYDALTSDVLGYNVEQNNASKKIITKISNQDIPDDLRQITTDIRASVFTNKYGTDPKIIDQVNNRYTNARLDNTVRALSQFEDAILKHSRIMEEKEEREKAASDKAAEAKGKKMEVDAQGNGGLTAQEITSLKKLCRHPQTTSKRTNDSPNRRVANTNAPTCSRCGSPNHSIRDCPRKAEDLTCNKCQRNGHTSNACKSGKSKGKNKGKEREKPRRDLPTCGFCNKRGHKGNECWNNPNATNNDTRSIKSHTTNRSTSSRKSSNTHKTNNTNNTYNTNDTRSVRTGGSSKNKGRGRVGRPQTKR